MKEQHLLVRINMDFCYRLSGVVVTLYRKSHIRTLHGNSADGSSSFFLCFRAYAFVIFCSETHYQPVPKNIVWVFFVIRIVLGRKGRLRMSFLLEFLAVVIKKLRRFSVLFESLLQSLTISQFWKIYYHCIRQR